MIPIIKLRIFNNDYVGNGAHTVPVHKTYKIIRLNARNNGALV